MKELENQGGNGVFGTVLGLLMLLLLVPAVWVLLAFNSRYRECVQLENGLNLGYEAVFDLSRPYFKPIAIPKFPDGTPLIRDEMWEIYITNTTVYGMALGPTSEEDYWYAWRADIGLVLKEDDPAPYERLVAEAGNANWDIEIGSIGTGWLLKELIRRPQFEVRSCPTSLITW